MTAILPLGRYRGHNKHAMDVELMPAFTGRLPIDNVDRKPHSEISRRERANISRVQRWK